MRVTTPVKVPRYRVRVYLLPAPSLWCWEVVDEDRGTVVRSSWEHDWMAYNSRDDAWMAGYAYVARLASVTPADDVA